MKPDDKVFARDEHWAVVRVARHASIESPEQFAETLLNCLRAGADVAEMRTRKRLATAENAVRLGLALNDEQEQTGKTPTNWDGKRRLLDDGVNPFRAFTHTAPYDTAKRADAARKRQLQSNAKKRRRTRRLSRKRLNEVMALLSEGLGPREVERITGVARSTVSRLKRRLNSQPRFP